MSDDAETTAHESTYDAMMAVMREIEVIAKNRQADQRMGGYNFRGYEDALEALAPACRKHGLLTPIQTGEAVQREYKTSGGAVMHWWSIPVNVHFHGTSDLDDVIVAGTEGEAADTGDKALSKAVSVAFREIMFKTFVIPVTGMGYDPEGGDEDVSAAAPSDDDLLAQERGWEDAAAFEAAWKDMSATNKGLPDGVATAAMKAWVKEQKITKGSFTPDHYSGWQGQMAVVDPETGDWVDGAEPF